MKRAVLPLFAVVMLGIILSACAPVRAVPPHATGAEQKRLLTLELQLYQRWYLYSLSSPPASATVDLERVISPAEAEAVYADCMTEAGFPGYGQAGTTQAVERSADGQQALFACVSRFPLDPATFGLFSGPQLDYLYDYYRDSLIPCLDAAGFPVASVPTRDEFLTRSPQQLFAWSPYQAIGFVPPETLTALSHKCLEYPRGIVAD